MTNDSQTYRVLLVEDNPADVYLFRQALNAAGLNVELTVIQDGSEALAFGRRQGEYAAVPIPDLAVIDLNLPKAGGAAVLAALRQQSDLAHILVAVISSAAETPEQMKAKALDCDRYITKPPDLDEFLQIGHILKKMLLERKTGTFSEAQHPAGQK
jgi:two-component system response regulator